MKYRMLYIFLIALVAFSYAQEHSQNPGYLSLESADPMTVLLNDTTETHSPITHLPLAPGTYRLKACITNNRNWYARPIIKSFVLEPGDSLRFVLEDNQYKLLQSFPSDALILTDTDSVIGKTPFIFRSDSLPRWVYLEKPGYLRRHLDMSEKDWPKSVVLKRDDEPLQDIRFPTHPPRQSFLKRHLKTGLVATAISANWLSFYMKRKADDYYHKYQVSSSLKQITYYYDKTGQYDLYASILLGVSTAATVTYLYMLIRD